MDYRAWLDRAVSFCKGLSQLPGECNVEIAVAPPLSSDEVAVLASTSRIPVPQSLSQFWQDAWRHCNIKFLWKVPDNRAHLAKLIKPDWPPSHISGGPEFLSANEIGRLSACMLEWAEDSWPDSPLDARFYEASLPLIQFLNGDYVGLYVRDNWMDPPVVHLSHELGGHSNVIAPSLSEFLRRWEEVRYLGVDLLWAARDRETGVFEPRLFPAQREAIQLLLS